MAHFHVDVAFGAVLHSVATVYGGKDAGGQKLVFAGLSNVVRTENTLLVIVNRRLVRALPRFV